MEAVLLAIHLLITIAMVAVILLQRSEGGALGIGGGPAGLMTSRGAADFLTKATRWLATIFILNALALGWIAAQKQVDNSIVDEALGIEQDAGEGSTLPDLPSLPDDDG